MRDELAAYHAAHLAGFYAGLVEHRVGKAAPTVEVLASAERPTIGRGYVIRGRDGRDPEVPLVNLKAPWATICEAAALQSLRLHDLRRAFASAAVNGGLSLPIIGALLGHRETRTTQRYSHLADDPQRLASAQIANWIAQALRTAE